MTKLPMNDLSLDQLYSLFDFLIKSGNAMKAYLVEKEILERIQFPSMEPKDLDKIKNLNL